MGENIVIVFMALSMGGLLLKIVALYAALEAQENSSLYRRIELLIGIQLVQTFFEFFGYLSDQSSWVSLVGLKLYYVTSFSTFALIPLIIAEINDFKIPKKIEALVVACAATIICLLVFTDLIIAGVGHTGISLTRIAGSLYWLFQISAPISILITFLILLKAHITNDGLLKLKSTNIALSFSLYSSYIVSIILIMIFFEGINAVGVLPIFMGIFTLCLAKSISNKKILDLTYWLPFSKRRRLINRLVKPLITVYDDGVDIDIKKEYDAVVAQHALQLFNGNQTRAASWLQTSQSWISRHDIS